MKRGMLALIMGIVLLVGVGCATVEPGYVGIKINKLGDNRGVDDLPTVSGFNFYNPFATAIYEYPTFIQNVSWTQSVDDDGYNEEITFNTSDKMSVRVDVGMAFKLQETKVPSFYVTFRNDDITAFADGFLRTAVKDSFVDAGGEFVIDNIMGDNAPFLQRVRQIVTERLAPIGVQVEQLGIIGSPRPPQSVLAAIDATQQAKQIALTVEAELRQSQGEAQKKIAAAEGEAKSQIARATGEAESNRLLTNSITQTLLEWKRLEAQQQSIMKWNGQLPQTVLGGNTPTILQIPTQR